MSRCHQESIEIISDEKKRIFYLLRNRSKLDPKPVCILDIYTIKYAHVFIIQIVIQFKILYLSIGFKNCQDGIMSIVCSSSVLYGDIGELMRINICYLTHYVFYIIHGLEIFIVAQGVVS